jgi:hypothetical protein
MKPFQTIKDANDVINDMKKDLQFSKDKVKDAKRINTLLDALKSFNDMLVYKYRTDAIEALIYSLIYEYFLMNKIWENEIPIHSTVNYIDFTIMNGAQQKKLEVISLLETHEMNNKIKDESVFDGDYTDFNKLLTDLLNEFKQTIKWNLIK